MRVESDHPTDIVLDPDDVVEDREIEDSKRDLLAHELIARQLDALAANAPCPSNIALYGPWGSGKSGIGQLLGRRIQARDGHKFARFDAYKFAETPLRRNFISAVARELDISNSEFHDDLYSGRTSTELVFPATKWLKIVLVFLAIVLSLTALLVGAVALISIFMPGGYGDAFTDLSKAVVAVGVVPAALLAGLITMANKTLQIDRSVAKPESDEQFEALFKRLVDKSGARRLVVFVDELDRCGADEVVATLDAIRTFLGVDKCIFVIAADQRVLEEALTKAARQETPGDDVNPYYSTGSAYLDKVFQYQVSVPPLLSQSITRFAADLVRERGGVWDEVNTDYIVSILVPTHVTSPRRVKHLLNAYALAFRLAEDRHLQGLLAESPKGSAAALARLVCLRVEFPLFARDLTVESRLPQMVLDLVADASHDWPFAVSEEAREIARRYANGDAAPAQILTEEDPPDTGHTGSLALTLKESNRQLITYLRRTKSVQGPSRDLVFLQSTGSDFGIDGDSALEIELAARNGETTAVSTRLSRADEEFRVGALRLLVHQMRTAVGVEAANSARTFLGVVEADDSLPIAAVADSAAEPIVLIAEESSEFLDGEVTPQAWTVASAGKADASKDLRRTILKRLADDDSSEIDTEFILRMPRPAIEVDTELLGQIVAREIVSENASIATASLRALDPSDSVATLRAALSPVVESLSRVIRERDEYEKKSQASTAPTSPARPAQPVAADSEMDTEEPFDPAITIQALQDLARTCGSGEVSDLVILALTRVDAQPGRDAVENLLRDEAVELVSDKDAINALLGTNGVQRRRTSHTLAWLNGVDTTSVNEGNSRVIFSLAKSIWAKLTADNEMSDAKVAGLVSALATLIERLPQPRRPTLTDMAVGTFSQAWATDDASAAHQSRAVRCVELCATTGLLSPMPAFREAVARLADTFAANAATPFERGTPLTDYLLGAALKAVHGADLDNEEGHALLKSVIDEARSTSVIDEPLVTEVILKYIEAAAVNADKVDFAVKAADIVELVDQHEQDAVHAAAAWFRVMSPDSTDSKTALDAILERSLLTTEVAEAIETARMKWGSRDAESFLRGYIVDGGMVRPTDTDLRAMGFRSVTSAALADMLVARYAYASNNTERQVVVDLWRRSAITDTVALRRLVEGVSIPLFGLNSEGKNLQAAGIGFSTLELLSVLPTGVKGVLGTAVKNAVGNNEDLEKRATKVMPPLGYKVETSGFLRRKSRPTYEEQ